MNSFFSGIQKRVAVFIMLGLFLAACSSDIAPRGNESRGEPLRFGPEVSLGTSAANPATPSLRFAPDGRLFAIWTEDETGQVTKSSNTSENHHSGKMAPSPLRAALLAVSSDNGKSWSAAKRVNTTKEAIQGEENGPKVAFTSDNRAYVVGPFPAKRATKRAPTFASLWTTAKVDLRPRARSTK